MPFSLIPDAELDAYPRLAWLLEMTFDLTMVALYHREAIFPPNFDMQPGTLLVSNHQRDSDAPILASLLCDRSGLRFKRPMPFYTGREDLLNKSFLRDFLEENEFPPLLVKLLARIPLGWLFRIGRMLPMRRVPEFSFGELLVVLRAMGYGTDSPDSWLRSATLQRVRAQTGAEIATLDELAGVLPEDMAREKWGLRRLSLAGFRSIRPSFSEVIDKQLRTLASTLDAGRMIYFAPEGCTSVSGRMGRIRAGTSRLHALARKPPSVQPLAISYDPLLMGRWRVVMQAGDTLQLDPSNKRHFNETMRGTILSLCVMTPSHLLSRWVLMGPARFDTHDCVRWFQYATHRIADAGMAVDPLIERTNTSELVAARLAWLRRRKLVRKDKGQWVRCDFPHEQPGWHSASAIAQYLNVCIDDVASQVPGLAGALVP